jgi:threonine dehydratase
MAPSAADVGAAVDRIRPFVDRTPVGELRALGISIKCEHLQRTGSFKVRGAANTLLQLSGSPGVVAASSGNHGFAVATLASAIAIDVVVVMAAGASPTKAARIREMGARVVEAPGDTLHRDEAARALALELGYEFVSSHDDGRVIAGQGTVAFEIVEDVAAVSAVVLPVGGGGLLAGCALALRAVAPHVRVIGVEPDGCDGVSQSMALGRLVTVPAHETICDGARVRRPGAVAFPIIEKCVDDLVVVSDDVVVAAMVECGRAGVHVEPTGALAVAAAPRLGLGRDAVFVVSGGNIAPSDWSRITTLPA